MQSVSTKDLENFMVEEQEIFDILHGTPKVVDTFLMPKNDNQLP
jgi:hypothetical protein